MAKTSIMSKTNLLKELLEESAETGIRSYRYLLYISPVTGQDTITEIGWVPRTGVFSAVARGAIGWKPEPLGDITNFVRCFRAYEDVLLWRDRWERDTTPPSPAKGLQADIRGVGLNQPLEVRALGRSVEIEVDRSAAIGFLSGGNRVTYEFPRALNPKVTFRGE